MADEGWIPAPDFDPAAAGEAGPDLPGADGGDDAPAAGRQDFQEREGARMRGWVVPHADTFASQYNQGLSTYWWRSDEALRRSVQDALAMRRDPLIHDCLRRRQMPVAALPYSVEPEDPKDERQRLVAQQCQRLLDAIPRFHHMRLSLLEAIFFGRAGVQIAWGRTTVNGSRWVNVIDHHPVHGDKIQWTWGGVPGIAVGALWAENAGGRPHLARYVRPSGYYGQVLFLETPELRSRFIIHEFEPTDTDYLYESELAGSIRGMGLRSRLWFPWNMRNEIASYATDAMQRLGANGLIAGFFPHGNDRFRDDVIDMLKLLNREHVAAIPYSPDQPIQHMIQQMPVNPTGYDVLKTFQDYWDLMIRETVLGEQGPSVASNTRLAAELVEESRFSMQRADVTNLAETLTNQLLEPMVNFNRSKLEALIGGPVDFRMKVKLQLERPNVIEDLQAAQLLVGLGQAMGIQVPIDVEALLDKAGLRPPEGGTNYPDPMAAMQAAAMGGGQPGAGMLPGGGMSAQEGTPEGPSSPFGMPMPGGGGGVTAPGLRSDMGLTRQPPRPVSAEGQPPDPTAKMNRPTRNMGGDRSRYARNRRADDPGVMVGFWLPEDVAEGLAVEGGEAKDELHLTLCYLGRKSEVGDDGIAAARAACKAVARSHGPFRATLGGIGRFSATDSSDGKDVAYASVDAPPLTGIRARVLEALDGKAVAWKGEHGFTPHVTLAYIDEGAELPLKRLEPVEATLDRLVLAVGDTRETFPLSGKETLRYARPRPASPGQMRLGFNAPRPAEPPPAPEMRPAAGAPPDEETLVIPGAETVTTISANPRGGWTAVTRDRDSGDVLDTRHHADRDYLGRWAANAFRDHGTPEVRDTRPAAGAEATLPPRPSGIGGSPLDRDVEQFRAGQVRPMPGQESFLSGGEVRPDLAAKPAAAGPPEQPSFALKSEPALRPEHRKLAQGSLFVEENRGLQAPRARRPLGGQQGLFGGGEKYQRAAEILGRLLREGREP